MFVCDGGYFIDIPQENESVEEVYNSAEDYNYNEGEYIMSETRYGFTKMNVNEFKGWLQSQGNYNYTGIQIHHTYSPSYQHFYKAGGGHEDELTRQNNMRSFHVNTNGWDTIAQHFTIFPNGAIVTGRNLADTTAIGIRGWNYNKICIEIYGNFDHGADVMTEEQKQAVIAVYGELCKKFHIVPSVATLRCHAWFSSGGTYLGDYLPGRSAKTCPGTNFMGFGNTKAAIENNFIPLVKQYMANGSVNVPQQPQPTPPAQGTSVNYVVKVTADSLNVRKGPSVDYPVNTAIKQGDAYTIVEEQNGWGRLKSGAGWVNLKYTEKLRDVPVSNPTPAPSVGYTVKVTADSLNIRKGPGVDYVSVGAIHKGDVYTIVETQNGWGKLKSGAGWVNLSYTQRTNGDAMSAVTSYRVQVNTGRLNVRKGPGTTYAAVATVKQGEVYTIVQTQSGWGRLKSGLGWISLAYTKKL